jgi:hypothetical protein
MSDLFFAIPWWLFGGLIVVGLVVAWTGIKQQQKSPMYVGLAFVLLALGLKTLSYFVETDREKCEKQTLEMVHSIEQKDWTKFTSLLDDEVSLGTSAGAIFSNRKELIDGVEYDSGKYDPKDFTMSVAHSEQDATGVTVDVDVAAQTTMMMGMGMRVPTSWKLQWQREGKEWKLHEIICTKIGNQSGNEMSRAIAK